VRIAKRVVVRPFKSYLADMGEIGKQIPELLAEPTRKVLIE
jgi:hypothetical protein